MSVRSGTPKGTARAAIAVAAAALLAQACGSVPQTRYYLLELPAAPSEASASADTSADVDRVRIGVAPPLVEAPFDQQRIAYRPPGALQEIGFYHYHRWSAPVGDLVQGALASALDRLPGIAAEALQDGPTYDVVLRATVVRLVELDSARGIEAVIELRWTADLAEGGVRSGETRVAEPVAQPAVDAVIDGFAAAIERAAAEIGRRLSDA